MSIQSVLLPVLLQVALVFVLLGALAIARRKAMAGGVAARQVALADDAFPPRARQIGNCYANQFEMPVLFFLAVIFGMVLHQTGWLFVLMEWAFVLFRVAHAGMHTGANVVAVRGLLFMGSAAAAAALWFLIFVGVFFGVVIA